MLAWHASAVTFLSAGLLALSAGMALAQSATDALACLSADHSESELVTWFANMSWDRVTDPAAIADFRATLIFVENLDGDHPDQWEATRSWARNPANTKPIDGAVLFQRGDTAVELGTDAGQRFCRIVSSRPMLDQIAAANEITSVSKIGMIRRLNNEGSGLLISAHELSAFALDEWDLPEDHRFVATFATLPPSEVTP